eukprot:3198749-Karenia_brevis.AAC.1
MAEITLSICNLSGHLTQLDVSPETLVSDVCAQFEKGLPEFHIAELFAADARLIRDSTLQEAGITSGCAVQVVAILDVEAVVCCLESHLLHQPMLFNSKLLSVLLQLDRLDDLDSSHCLRLMESCCNFIEDAVWQSPYCPDDLHHLDLEFCNVGSFQFDVYVCIVCAKACGRICGDPSPRVFELVKVISNVIRPWKTERQLASIDFKATLALIALGVLDSQHGEALLELQLNQDVKSFIQEVVDQFNWQSCYSSYSYGNNHYRSMEYAAIIAACRLLGKFGSSSAIEVLESAKIRFLKHPDEDSRWTPSWGVEIDQALRQIAARNGEAHKLEYDGPLAADSKQTSQVEEQAQGSEAGHGAAAQDGAGDSWELAIRDSLQEAVASENAQVQEALLRSKIDDAKHQELVVLSLTKRSSHVLNALLEAPDLGLPRSQIQEAGFEILPEYANGAILLAPLSEQQALDADVHLRPHHIVVARQFQPIVEQILSTLPKRQRPKVRLADDQYLCQSASVASATKEKDDALSKQSHLDEDDMWDGIWSVERSFVHCPIPLASAVPSRMAYSEP